VAKRLKLLEAYRQGISLSELKRRQKLEETGGIGNNANISSVTHSTTSDSAGFAAEMVLVHEVRRQSFTIGVGMRLVFRR
jgi:hypothetical protein